MYLFCTAVKRTDNSSREYIQVERSLSLFLSLFVKLYYVVAELLYICFFWLSSSVECVFVCVY